MDKKKKFYLNLEAFRDIFQICPRVHGQDFDELPTDVVIVSLFKELGHTREIKSITDGMYYKKNMDYVELLWEDFTYQINNKGYKKQEKMYYPRFTKVIIQYFLTKDKTENEEEIEDDEEQKEDEFVKTPSNYTPTDDEDETNVESKVKDNVEGNEDKVMNYTTNEFDDDVDVRLNDPVNADEWFIQKEEIVSPMDVHVYHEVPSSQTPTLLTVSVTVITQSSHVCTTSIPQLLPYYTPPPPLSTPIPPPTTKATNPLYALLNFVSVFQFNNRVSALEKEVFELRKDDLLNTQVIDLVDEHLDSRIRATIDEFMSYLSASITARITEQHDYRVLEYAVLANESSQPQSTYEATVSLIEFELKKILIEKIDKSQSYLRATPHINCYDGFLKSFDLDKKELEFKVADSDMPHNQEGNLGNDDEEPMRDVASKRRNLIQKTQKVVIFDLTKPLRLVMNGNHQIVQVDFFFNNDLKYLQGRISTMTYMTSITKIKANQYDLPGIEDMVPNIWSPVKVACDKHAK
uniref:Uncharacterized protein n=1 Tax=Tanacetum cinerariifolium TaxID=118510 RepID=A0A6L2KZE9_TANCI|nr:hypothetical protein [Tanacetum cinerariifolium]